ncbi:MAG: tRNA lysidine(34) synthetase TilS [Terriglobia bacterium]
MELLQKVEGAIRRGELLAPGMRVAVACSGGADSVALVHLLGELKEALGLRLLVVHLNHQLRGAEADGDEAFVRQLAERQELEFLVGREDVAMRARQRKLNLEEAGREARQEFFARLVTNGRADVVAVAHTMDDQAETVLARIVRGAGTKGLAGIYPVVEPVPGAAAGRLVRPLLEVRRAELRAYLEGCQQAWREDASNRDPSRLRNRIRLELVPKLTEVAGPGAVEHLARLARHAREEESFWAAYVEERFRALARVEADECELPVAGLLAPGAELEPRGQRAAREAQRAVARRLLRRAVRTVRGDLRRITQSHVESALRLAERGQSGQRVELPGVVVARQFDSLVLRPAGRGARPTSANYRVRVEGPGCVELPGGRALRFEIAGIERLERGYNKERSVADAGRARFPLVVRNWQPGDSYQPLGAPRRKKVKTLFQEQRIPVEERARTPVVLCEGEIVWVPRWGVAAAYGLSRESRRALVIEERGEA